MPDHLDPSTCRVYCAGPLFNSSERGEMTAIAEVLSARYAVVPDMRWVDMSHFISPDGSKACSEWTVKGTPEDGEPIDWLGCVERIGTS